MTRGEALTFLTEQWPGLQGTLGVLSTDAAGGFKSAIDAALLALGVARADLVTAVVAVGDEARYGALLRYYGVLRLYGEAAGKADLSITGAGGISKRYSNLKDSLDALLGMYSDDLAIYGVVVGDQMTWGVFTPDTYEPSLDGGW